jgi:hypothetical protein
MTTTTTKVTTCDGCGAPFFTPDDPSNIPIKVTIAIPDQDYKQDRPVGFQYEIDVHGFQCLKSWVEAGVRKALPLAR